MKLTEVRIGLDSSKAMFYFTAEGRVDFRELVKDLTQHLRTRVELRQIGVRDEARVLGATGRCGQPLCCRAFLQTFAPVSIRMAKDQNLALNPAKLSGMCGRLKCCLAYEHPLYAELKRCLPKIGCCVTSCRRPASAPALPPRSRSAPPSSASAVYITTPIYYVNAPPHSGHAYTTIVADTVARYHRLAGRRVYFLTGTDEHGDKIAQAAAKAQESPQGYTDRISAAFREAWQRMGLTFDQFIRN